MLPIVTAATDQTHRVRACVRGQHLDINRRKGSWYALPPSSDGAASPRRRAAW
eukprot:COSAG01_NODE_40262_length_465_cov_35.174863_1_plen_52_part_01